MPELTEQMYCHQQICIPPAFPYLLRQYAKAAIRSQPVDLLKWSTAYWRCLSLNIPPPVKPRLEYPIPRDFYGVTPGWLKALNYQLLNCKTVPFRILWDRWMGACLQHNTLIQLLCLGGFTDAAAIPWNRFIALCAGTLTDNLTNTMILICEILTEEPEGGSAEISVDVFLDLYKFLASIDASQAQTLLNLYFTDAALGILPKRKRRRKKKVPVKITESMIYSTTTEEPTVEEEIEERVSMGEASIISCPDIASDDVYPESLEIFQESVKEPSNISIATIEFNPITITQEDDHQSEEGQEEEEETQQVSQFEDEEEREDTQKDLDETQQEDERVGEEYKKEDEVYKKEDEEYKKEDEVYKKEDEEYKKEDEVYKKEDEVYKKEDEEYKKEDDFVMDDFLEIVTSLTEFGDEEKSGEEEKIGEDTEELVIEEIGGKSPRILSLERHFKAMILDEVVEKYLTATETVEVEVEAEAYEEKIKPEYVVLEAEVKGEDEYESVEGEELQAPYEEVYVDAIPGIGPVVPDEVVEAVVKYFMRVSAEDHGMAMPRHIRHYSCPPLEVIEII